MDKNVKVPTPLLNSLKRLPSTYNVIVIEGEEAILKEIQYYLVYQNEDNPAVPGYHVNVLFGAETSTNEDNLNYHFYNAASYIYDTLSLLKSETITDISPTLVNNMALYVTDTYIAIIDRLKEQGSTLSPFLNFYYNRFRTNTDHIGPVFEAHRLYFNEMMKKDENDVAFFVRLSFDVMRELSKYDVEITEHDFDHVLYVNDKDTDLVDALLIEGKFKMPDDFKGYRLCTAHELESEEQNEIITDGCLVLGIPTRYGDLLKFSEEIASFYNVKITNYWGNGVATGEYLIEDGKTSASKTEANVIAVGHWLQELGVYDFYSEKFNLPELWGDEDEEE